MSTVDDLFPQQREHRPSQRHIPRRARRRPRPSLGSRISGAVGEVFLTVGVLLALFVVWQVWWTDVVAHRAADEHIQQWEEQFPDPVPQVGEPRDDEPPGVTPVGEGEQMATMYVPSWGTDWQFPIAEGVDYATVLDAGFVGHYPETALPGEVGNFAVAGHRQSYGRPFHAVDELRPGDEIIVRTENAWLVYHVSDYEIIRPHEVEVLLPVPRQPEAEATERMITLTTCHPLWSIAERYVVYGELDHWMDPAEGRPQALEGV